jgi:hypothetical protein
MTEETITIEAEAEIPSLTSINTSNTPFPQSEQMQVVIDDPYDFDRCQISASIVWMGEGDQRQVMVGVRNHMDAPILRVYEAAGFDMAMIPEVFRELLETLREQLPVRAMEKIKRDEEGRNKAKPAARKLAPMTASRSASVVKNQAQPVTIAAIAKPVVKAPTPAQISLFDMFTTGG